MMTKKSGTHPDGTPCRMCPSGVDSPDLWKQKRQGDPDEHLSNEGQGNVASDLPRHPQSTAVARHEDRSPESCRCMCQREGRDALDWLTFIVSALTLVAVSIAGYFAYWASDANRRSADAATAYNTISTESFMTGRRAYVLLNEIPMQKKDDPDGPGSRVVETEEGWSRVAIHFQNFGDGPAKDVVISTQLSCAATGERCPDPGGIEQHPGSRFVMGPHHPLSSDIDFMWEDGSYASEAKLIEVGVRRLDCLYEDVVPADPSQKPKRVLYALTRINYLDQFGRPHWTHVCAVWNRVQATWDAASSGNDFE